MPWLPESLNIHRPIPEWMYPPTYDTPELRELRRQEILRDRRRERRSELIFAAVLLVLCGLGGLLVLGRTWLQEKTDASCVVFCQARNYSTGEKIEEDSCRCFDTYRVEG